MYKFLTNLKEKLSEELNVSLSSDVYPINDDFAFHPGGLISVGPGAVIQILTPDMGDQNILIRAITDSERVNIRTRDWVLERSRAYGYIPPFPADPILKVKEYLWRSGKIPGYSTLKIMA